MKYRFFHRISLILILLLVFPLTSPAAALQDSEASPDAAEAKSASAPPSFGVTAVGDYPEGYFSLEMAPGARAELTARIMMLDSNPTSITAYISDTSTGTNGGFIAGEMMNPDSVPTTWMELTPVTEILEGDQTLDVSFSVSVPSDTAPGQYIASFVAQTSEPVAVPGTTDFTQIIRGAVAVMITVPGPVSPKLVLGEPAFSADPGTPRLVIPVMNRGNVLIKPAGDLTITTPDGTVVTEAPIVMGSVYAGDETTLEISLPEQLPESEYVISGSLIDPETGVSASIDQQTIILSERDSAPPTFTIDPIQIAPNADPIQFADVAMTVNNARALIPTSKVVLNVKRDGKDLESYPLTQNQALPTRPTDIAQRYIPLDGWQPGTYEFEIVAYNVSNGVETILATVAVAETIEVP